MEGVALMNSDDLKELREVFRARMQEEDFDIGEEKVEKLFRELLNEPEPTEPELYISDEQRAKLGKVTQQVNEVAKEIFTPDRIEKIFAENDLFYSNLRKK